MPRERNSSEHLASKEGELVLNTSIHILFLLTFFLVVVYFIIAILYFHGISEPSRMVERDTVRSQNEISKLQSNVSAGDPEKSSDKSMIKEGDKSSVNNISNDEKSTVNSTADSTRTAVGVNEIDSSISKSVVLSSEDNLVSEDDKTKEDAMEVDTECTGSESHIQTSSTIM